MTIMTIVTIRKIAPTFNGHRAGKTPLR